MDKLTNPIEETNLEDIFTDEYAETIGITEYIEEVRPPIGIYTKQPEIEELFSAPVKVPDKKNIKPKPERKIISFREG